MRKVNINDFLISKSYWQHYGNIMGWVKGILFKLSS